MIRWIWWLNNQHIYYIISFFEDIFFSFNFCLLHLQRSLYKFLLKFNLKIILRFFSNLECTIDFSDGIRFLFGELNFLNELINYHCFFIKWGTVKFPSGLHGRIYIFVNDEGLPSHSDIFLGNDLNKWKIYIENFAVFLESLIKSIFEFVNRYFFIKIVNVNGIIRGNLFIIVFYLLVAINLPWLSKVSSNILLIK